jgi:hypothetical protein
VARVPRAADRALDGERARHAQHRLDHRLRRGERDLLPALLRRPRRLPRL